MSPCQQNELYASEARVPGRNPITLSHAQKIADDIREFPWYVERFSDVKRIEIVCDPQRRDSVGSYYKFEGAGLCEMAPEHMNVQFILHEIAHVLCEARFGHNAHGPWFARIYLTLVYLVQGSRAYHILQTSFQEDGIDYDVDL